APTNAVKLTTVTATITRFTALERRIPVSTSSVTARITPIARSTTPAVDSTPTDRNRYPASPNAAVAAEALLAQRNIHPARKPRVGLRSRRPYSYVPPLTGKFAASCALLKPLQAATPAAAATANSTAGPAASAP